jgi:hypothetical protein
MNAAMISETDEVQFKVTNSSGKVLLGPVDKVLAEQYAYKMLMEHNMSVKLVPVTKDGKNILLG